MSFSLDKEIRLLLDDPESSKIVATTDEEGAPHAAPSPFLHIDGQGAIVHVELLETSVTNRNLLRSLWYGRKVAVSLTGKNGRSYLVKGLPVRALISGPVFSGYYEKVRGTLGDVDLAAVWFINPLEEVNETYIERKSEEEALYPFSIHIDRLVATGAPEQTTHKQEGE